MNFHPTFLHTLRCESDALIRTMENISPESIEKVVEVFERLIQNEGTLFFTGIGKSGLIAKKLASTFASLGLPSFFLHPIEAMHGDLGRVRSKDALVMISKSGTTEEILKLFPYLPVASNMIIGLLGHVQSPLALKSYSVLDCSVLKEACVNNQAPTTSTTVALVVGDALAVLYENMIGLSKEKFAENHPSGILGKTLRLQVSDLMIPYESCAVLEKQATLKDVILKLTEFPNGACAIVENNQKLLGILVDGDIRRIFNKKNNGETEQEILGLTVESLMNPNPIVISSNERAFTALEKMEKRQGQITVLPVVDSENHKFLGLIRLHDLIREGFLS